MGKTALGIQLAHHLSVEGSHPVLFVTLEMRKEEIGLRLQGLMLGKSTKELRAGHYARGECSRVLDAIARSQFHLVDATAPTVTEVAGQIRRAVHRHRVEAVVVDHLGKMRGTRRESRYLEVGELAQTLKATAKQLGVPIVALHQLNRNVDHRDSPRPRLADLRDSGNVEEEADAIVFLWTAEERPEQKDSLPIHLYLAKNRHGETDDWAYLFHKRLGRFVEASDRADGEGR
jgi:replicative DNA helicase